MLNFTPSSRKILKINLAESIREVLFDRNPVSIYGLGTLCLRQIPADYGEDRKTLLPPTMVLDFIETSSSNKQLHEWLSLKYDISNQDADKAMRKFSEMVLNNLLNYGSVSIKGVAFLERDGDNDIICVADDSLLSSFYDGMPEVLLELPQEKPVEQAINPVVVPLSTATESQRGGNEDDLSESDVSEAENQPAGTLGEAESGEVKKPAIAMADSSDKSQSDIETDDMIVFDLESEFKDIEEVPGQDQAEEIEPSYPEHQSLIDEKPNYRRIWGSILIIIALLVSCFLIYDACNVYRHNKEIKKNEVLEDNALHLSDAQAGDETAAAMLQGSELEPQPAALDSCIIITGVFASQNNVSNMIEKVLSFGYQPYTEVNGLYVRTGLIFECSDTDLESFIRLVRRQISPKAWYLQPELYVAYGTE